MKQITLECNHTFTTEPNHEWIIRPDPSVSVQCSGCHDLHRVTKIEDAPTKRSVNIKSLQVALAEKGILAIYGGRKGHGFWLYQTTPEAITEYFAKHGWCDIPGTTIKNDGKHSGNPHFTMFSDAAKLVA